MRAPTPQIDSERRRDERLQILEAASLYFVCEGRPGDRDPEPLLDSILGAGVAVIQLREKSERSDAELIKLAQPFRAAARRHGALFVLNDRPDLVAATGADGVHVGQADTPVAEARSIAGPDAIVGLSTHDRRQLAAARAATGAARPDQISVGPIWATPTKPGRPATGLDLIRHAAAGPSEPPWFAIGGIDERNIGEVAAAGARRAVIVRAIRDSADPVATVRLMQGALGGERA